MKKSLLVFAALLLIFQGCKKENPEQPEEKEDTVHFKVLDFNGNALNNNEEFVFDTTGTAATLRLMIQNLTDKEIKIKTKLIETNGDNGSEFQVCIGNCYPSMQPGVEYPVNVDYVVEANSTTPPDDIHYTNFYSVPCYYKVEIYEVDDNGDKVGEAFTFKYIYQP